MSNEYSTSETATLLQTTCCIVGCGPAGAMLGLLLARQGIPVILLEAAKDLDRDFRGDTIHPTTLEILRQLGLVDKLLQIPHTKLSALTFKFDETIVTAVDFSSFSLRYPYVALMPQEKFLAFLVEEAEKFPHFHLLMGANVRELIVEQGITQGVRYRQGNSWYEVRAQLTVAADGRSSRIRALTKLDLKPMAQPLELLWFRVEKGTRNPEITTTARFMPGCFSVVLNREDHWQVAYFISPNSYQRLREAGVANIQRAIAHQWPEIAEELQQLTAWKQLTHLSVQVGYLTHWYQPGLLFIGDAAHVMSPIGGFGINLAIQDAIIAANTLTKPLHDGIVPVHYLQEIQKKRIGTTRIFQMYQSFSQRRLIRPILQQNRIQLQITRLLMRLPLQRIIMTKLISHGANSMKIID